ncbi:ATP-binding cassette domain-containing protein, partial [bacterium]|nr:ATP-binding cassette domain-containing protein [bacterium]
MKNLLEIENLKTYFYINQGVIKAVDDVSFSLKKGETLGLVGESGCGKTVTALSIMRLLPDHSGCTTKGKVLYKERNILALKEKELQRIRGREISLIFQEPMFFLNPVYTIGNQISEVMLTHQNIKKKEALEKTIEML